MSNKKIFPKLYSGVKIGLGAVCTSVGGMLHYLYGWSHDFAHDKWVGLPFTNPGLGVTGAQWEYTNLIGAEAVGVGLGIAGGYLIASGYRDLKALAVQVKSAAQKLNEKCSIRKKELDYIFEKHKIPLDSKLENYLQEDKKIKLTDLETKIIAPYDYEEKNWKENHSTLAKKVDWFKKYVTLPASTAAHIVLISTIHATWMAAYYQNQEYIGAIKEPTLWNWIWYIGTTSTYALIVASSFAKFSEEEKGVKKLEKKLRKYEIRSLRKKVKDIVSNKYTTMKRKISL